MITLQFSSAKGLFSRTIGLFSWSWASHVDFVLPSGKLLGSSIEFGGVKIHEMPDINTYKRVERYSIDTTKEVEDLVYKFALRQLGKPYDLTGVLGFIPRKRDWQKTDSWFCSELVSASFIYAGFPLLNEKTFRISPRDLLISPYLKFEERIK